VIGIDTAGSAQFTFAARATQAYAIPINKAVQIAKQILSGKGSATVHIGATSFPRRLDRERRHGQRPRASAASGTRSAVDQLRRGRCGCAQLRCRRQRSVSVQATRSRR
jgi:hypothetical protein